MAFDEQRCPALARGVRRQTDTVTGEPILLFPEGLLQLSETANAILACCDGSQSVATIIAELAAEYEADPEMLRQDVLDCLVELQQRKLVVF